MGYKIKQKSNQSNCIRTFEGGHNEQVGKSSRAYKIGSELDKDYLQPSDCRYLSATRRMRTQTEIMSRGDQKIEQSIGEMMAENRSFKTDRDE